MMLDCFERLLVVADELQRKPELFSIHDSPFTDHEKAAARTRGST